MKIKKKLDEIYPFEFENDIDKVAKELTELKDAFPGYERYYLQEIRDYDVDDKYFVLFGERDATPEEEQAALSIEKIRVEEDRKNKLRQLEQLKKELGVQ